MAYKQTGGIARIKNVFTDGLRYRLADARGEVLGRFAACVSRVLQGKDKPTYEPHRAEGDVVVVTNAKDIVLTGRKLEDKKYYRHTGYVGNLVTRTAKEMMEREPTFLIRKAVERMLPKNKLRKDMMRKLRVFPGETHAFDDVPLVPLKMPPRVIRARKVPRHTMPEGFTPLNPVAFAKNVALATKSNDALAALEAKKAAAAEWRRDPAMTNPPPAHETEHSRAGR